MSYTPNNVSVYLAAFSGCLASVGSPGTGHPSVDAPALADAFAQAVDTQWGAASLTAFEVTSIQQLSLAAWSGRSPLVLPAGLTPSSYSAIANAIVSLAANGNAQIIGEGIDPNSPASPSSPSGGLTPPANGSWSVANWWIDPVSGSDLNTGKTSGSPLKTWKALVALWGTYAPVLNQTTTITFLNDQSDSSDPVVFEPILGDFGAVGIVGTLVQTASGTLGTVVSKNRATPQLLTANISPNAAGAQGLMLFNTTHAAHCFVESVSGNVATLTQPLAANDTYPGTFPICFPAEVDTFAISDAYTLQRLTKVYVMRFCPHTLGQLAHGLGAFIQHIWVPTGVALPATYGTIGMATFNQGVCLVESRVDRFVNVDNTNEVASLFGQQAAGAINCWMPSGGSYRNWCCVGGAYDTLQSPEFSVILSAGTLWDGDAIIHGPFYSTPDGGNGPFTPNTGFGLVYFDCTVAGVNIEAPTLMEVEGYGVTAIVWGKSLTINVYNNATLFYQGTATAAFPSTTTLQINGSNQATSTTHIAPSVINAGVSLTVAHLDAAAGVAGFSGRAFEFGLGAIIRWQ